MFKTQLVRSRKMKGVFHAKGGMKSKINYLIFFLGWLISEKLDGIRAFWDGAKLLTRQGKIIPAPDSFIRDLPRDVALDGELWYDALHHLSDISCLCRSNMLQGRIQFLSTRAWCSSKITQVDGRQGKIRTSLGRG